MSKRMMLIATVLFLVIPPVAAFGWTRYRYAYGNVYPGVMPRVTQWTSGFANRQYNEVYRSPDALYINGEMIRHAWRATRNMRYLGQFDPGPRMGAATAASRKAKTISTPARPRSRSARRARR